MTHHPPTPAPPVIRNVCLRTPDAGRLADFYGQLLGLVPQPDASHRHSLRLVHPSKGDALLALIEQPGVRRASPRAPGLFHAAFLFAAAEDWAAAVRRALALPGGLRGASDHGVSWAVYLEDPDGNGLELAWDTPAHTWPWHGERISMVSDPLPFRRLLDQTPSPGPSIGAFTIGHLHLQVADLGDSITYQEALGLRVTQSDYPGAVFMARGRYHHHFALNTWRTNPREPAPQDTAGLVGWEMTHGHDGPPSSWLTPSGARVTLLPD